MKKLKGVNDDHREEATSIPLKSILQANVLFKVSNSVNFDFHSLHYGIPVLDFVFDSVSFGSCVLSFGFHVLRFGIRVLRVGTYVLHFDDHVMSFGNHVLDPYFGLHWTFNLRYCTLGIVY